MRPWLLGLILVAAFAAPAGADEVVKSMSAVQACLCARQALAERETDVNAERKRYEDAKRDSESLDRTTEDARAHLNTENRADIEAFSALVTRRDQVAQSFRDQAARYTGAVQRYNEAVNANNSMCLGRLFDPEQVEAAKATLSCAR